MFNIQCITTLTVSYINSNIEQHAIQQI